MLETLTIRNYAVIGELHAAFTPGLTVITGETGAGKSIVVHALEKVRGARASTDIIRAGTDCCEVTAVFTGEPGVLEGDLPVAPEDGVLILRREVRGDGNNRCFLNDRPVTLRTLKDIGDRLVDFHGQHDHQSLFLVPRHVEFLDGYARLAADVAEVRRLHAEVHKAKRDLADLAGASAADERERDLYEFQRKEIEAAALHPGEDTELETAMSRLSRAEELKTLAFTLFQSLSDAEDAVSTRLGELAGTAEEIARVDESARPEAERLALAIDAVEEAARFFRSYGEGIEDDPALLAEVEERFALVERLKKKYGGSIEAVIAYRDRIAVTLDRAARSVDDLTALEARVRSLRRDLAEYALILTEARKVAAPRLAAEVESHLAELGMTGARLVVAVEAAESGEPVETLEGALMRVTANGADRVEFLLAANPGEPPRPLVKVASGGEISRVMLALKLALLDAAPVPTMVFDEIDNGVSGRVGEAVGLKLARLTEHRQALVITHLPQIAVMADRHFSARKTTDGGRASAGLVLLDEASRERELASLLSGAAVTDTALAHARELLDAVRRRKAGNHG